MLNNRFSLHRKVLLALSLGLFTTANLPILAQAKSLNQKEVTRWEETPHPSPFSRFEGKMLAIREGSTVRFRPPNVGTPHRRTGAAVRGGGGCGFSAQDKLVALLPATEPVLTVAEYPTVFVFVSLPQTTAKEADFTLWGGSNQDKVVYETTIKLPSKPGIVSFSLPKNRTLPPLEVGKSYYWDFSVACDPQNRAEALVAQGQIQRVELNRDLVKSLKNASLRDRPAVYAEAGIWYDALTSLAELHRSSPQDSTLAADWAELLKSVGLETIAQEPLIP